MSRILPDVSQNFLSQFMQKQIEVNEKMNKMADQFEKNNKLPEDLHYVKKITLSTFITELNSKYYKVENIELNNLKEAKKKLTEELDKNQNDKLLNIKNKIEILYLDNLIDAYDILDKYAAWYEFIGRFKSQKPDLSDIKVLLKIYNYGISSSYNIDKNPVRNIFIEYLKTPNLDPDIKQKLTYAIKHPVYFTGINTELVITTASLGVSAILFIIAAVFVMIVIIIFLLFVGVVICICWIAVGLTLIKRDRKPYTWRNILLYSTLGPIAPYV